MAKKAIQMGKTTEEKLKQLSEASVNDGSGTLERKKKDSYAWYKEVIETNGECLLPHLNILNNNTFILFT